MMPRLAQLQDKCQAFFLSLNIYKSKYFICGEDNYRSKRSTNHDSFSGVDLSIRRISTIFQFVLMITSVLQVSTDDQPVIEEGPSVKHEADVGVNVRMNCVVRNFYDVYWEIQTRKNAFLYPVVTANVRLKVPSRFSSRITWDWDTQDPKKFQLIIRDLEKDDEGIFICHAKGPPHHTWDSKTKKASSRPTTLEVIDIGEEKYKQSPENIFTVVGNDARMTCRVDVEDDVVWYFTSVHADKPTWIGKSNNRQRGGEIFSQSGHYSWDENPNVEPNSDLIISKVHKSDEGFYECRINYEGTIIKRGANLTVLELPEVSDEFEERKVISSEGGLPVEVECDIRKFYSTQTVYQYPQDMEKIAWLDQNLNVLIYDGLKITNNPRIYVDLFKRTKMFFTMQLSYQDSQLYYCVSLTSPPKPVWFEHQIHVENCPDRDAVNGELWWRAATLVKCYGTPQEPKRFGEAEIWCRKRGAHLAMPKTFPQKDKITRHMHGVFDADPGDRKVWIGVVSIERNGSWIWVDGRIVRFDQSKYFWGQDNHQGQYCVTMSKDGKWYDDDCDRKLHFMCELPDIDVGRIKKLHEERCPKDWVYFECGKLCYNTLLTRAPWSEAKSICANHGAKVAMPKTLREHDFVKMVLANVQGNDDMVYREGWIGLTKTKYDTGYEWLDGVVEHWIWWGSSGSTSDYTCHTMNPAGKINARQCSQPKHVVCQKPQKMTRDLRPPSSQCGETYVPTNIGEIKWRSKRDLSPGSGLKTGRIVRGKLMAIEDFPWTVRVKGIETFNCSGVLISSRHVMTSAHCVSNNQDRVLTPSEVHITLGSEDILMKSGRQEPVHSIHVHDLYVGNQRGEDGVQVTLHYDVAVVELKRAQQTDCWRIRSACFDPYYDNTFNPPFVGYDCILTGWGGYDNTVALEYCKIESGDFAGVGNYHGDGFQIKRGGDRCSPYTGDSGSALVCKKEKGYQWHVAAILSAIGYQVAAYFNPHAEEHEMWIHNIITKDSSSENKVYEITVCERNWLDISCDYGRPPTIKVEKAVWGRLKTNVCPADNGKKTGCSIRREIQVRKWCNGYNRCRFYVNENVLGDACPEDTKYFTMQYRCVHRPLNIISCTNTVVISCGLENNLVIKITKAQWGRSNQKNCPNRITKSKCRGRGVSNKIRERCDGKVTCTVGLSVEFLGDPCKHYQKYIEVFYECQSNDIEYHLGSSAYGLIIPNRVILALSLVLAVKYLGSFKYM